jgi:DNA-binding transcriptional LysR family regulator
MSKFMLDVRRLRVFCQVVRRGSIAAAADALSYTPSAVSQQIAALEREAGTTLLERRARGVVPTEAGLLLAGHAEAVLAELDAAETALRDLAEVRRGQLRIGSFATAAANVLPQAIDRFRLRHPAVRIRVDQASPAESIRRLGDGSLDLALVVDLEPPAPEGVDVIPLFEDPVRLAVHRDHPFAAAAEIRLEELRGETWIDVPARTSGGKVLSRACEAAGFAPRVGLESDDYTVIQELVGVGAGVALLPDLALCPPHEDVVLRGLGPDAPRRHVQVATRAPAFRSAATQAMLAVLAEVRPRLRSAGAPAAQPATAAPPSR